MPEKWAGRLVGKMFMNRIANEDVARELGVSPAYISMILNGKSKTKGIRQRMEGAVDAIIQRRQEENGEEVKA
jgi:transcriptional regulator with XRE-family HTH domain